MSVTLAALIAEAKMLANTNNFTGMGADSTAQNAQVAEIINRATREFLEDNPALGLTTDTFDTVADTQSYAIPTDLQGVGIEQIAFATDDDDPDYQGRPLEAVSRMQSLRHPAAERNGEVTGRPRFWTLGVDATTIWLWPNPDAVYSLVTTYRQEFTVITGSLVATPGVTTLPIPTDHSRTPALLIAAEIALRQPERRAALLSEYAAARAETQRRVSEVMALTMMDTRAFDPEDFAGGMGASIGRRFEYPRRG